MDNRNLDGILWSKTASGYWINAKLGYQHVYVYEKLTGCKVFDWQVVHHLDRDKENNTAENLVCMTESDHRSFHGATLSEEARKKIGLKQQGNAYNLGKKASEATRKKMSKSHKGTRMSDQAKDNMSRAKVTAPLRADSTTGFRGVSYNKEKQKYVAQIFMNKRLKYLGAFPTPEEAARAYDAKARELWGDDAYQNMKAV